MFQQFDDPVPFRPTEALLNQVKDRGRRLRRRRRVAAAASGLAVSVATIGAAGALYVRQRDAAIDRVEIISPQTSTEDAVNILVYGSDSRAGFEDESEVAGERADTIMLVRVREDGSINVLGIPRDLVDPFSGQRLGTALQDGGPQGLIDMVHSLLGVPVDHFVGLDMQGFVDLVDEAGGIQLGVETTLSDDASGLYLEATECTTLDGQTALALLRARHLDQYGDMGRMARGQAVMSAALAALSEQSLDLRDLDRISRILADHAILDDGLSLRRVAELGRAIADAGPSGITAQLLPVVVPDDLSDMIDLEIAEANAAYVLQQYGGGVDPYEYSPSVGEPPYTYAESLSEIQIQIGTITSIHPC